jgi:hypothetical protein
MSSPTKNKGEAERGRSADKDSLQKCNSSYSSFSQSLHPFGHYYGDFLRTTLLGSKSRVSYPASSEGSTVCGVSVRGVVVTLRWANTRTHSLTMRLLLAADIRQTDRERAGAMVADTCPNDWQRSTVGRKSLSDKLSNWYLDVPGGA